MVASAPDSLGASFRHIKVLLCYTHAATLHSLYGYNAKVYALYKPRNLLAMSQSHSSLLRRCGGDIYALFILSLVLRIETRPI
jgi:hypothetical protein